MYEQEIEVFNNERARLLKENPEGGVVVIKDTRILGVWKDRLGALSEGLKEWGDVPFLVKSITEDPIFKRPLPERLISIKYADS